MNGTKDESGMEQPDGPASPGEGRRRRVRELLAHRHAPVAVAIVAMVLALPSLRAGWWLDDHYHRLVARGSDRFEEWLGTPMDMFRFFDGNPQRTHWMMDVGVVPWWTFEGIKGTFWRPVTVLTHLLDYRVWPDHPVWMHVQSVLWFGAMVLAVAHLYRRMMPAAWVAALAGLLYGIDDAHATPIGFLANRNTLLATLFGVLALVVHDRWRRDGWRAGAVLGPVLMLVSLLSAEAGIATLAYLFAYAVFLDRGSRLERAASLVAYGVVVVGWRIVWTSVGSGAVGMGLYIDPVHEPARFAMALVERVPVLLLGQWGFPPGDLFALAPPMGRRLLWIWAVLFVAAIGIVLGRRLYRDSRARFWATGMILSLLPVCATFPLDRLLLFVGIGAMGLLAQFLAAVFDRAESPTGGEKRAFLARPVAYVMLLLHLVAAPVALVFRSGAPMGPARILNRLEVRVELDESVADQDLVIVNPPSPLHAGYVPILADLRRQPIPRHTRALSPGLSVVTVSRPDERTLVITPEGGYLARVFDRLFRSERCPMTLGQRVELTGMTVEVTGLTADGDPSEATFRFGVPLEDPSLRWLCWVDGRFAPFRLPAVGETATLTPGRLVKLR